MKRILLLATTIMFATVPQSFAQYISLGPVGGFGTSWVGNMPGTTKFQPSGYLGVGLIYAKNVHWGWGGQLQVSSEGYRKEDMMGDISMVNPVYLRLPLRAYYFFGKQNDNIRPKLYLGPSFGLKLAESSSMSPYYSDAYIPGASNDFRTFDFGLNAGAGVNIRLVRATWLNLDLGYYQGLTDAVKDPSGNYNVNHNLALNVGVLFGIK
ncbi:MAG TPA: porin family protein [Flavipsychrobacter sp.]|nr:porin family protein [Flavipsychrobacter sp.]